MLWNCGVWARLWVTVVWQGSGDRDIPTSRATEPGTKGADRKHPRTKGPTKESVQRVWAGGKVQRQETDGREPGHQMKRDQQPVGGLFITCLYHSSEYSRICTALWFSLAEWCIDKANGNSGPDLGYCWAQECFVFFFNFEYTFKDTI